MKSFPIVIVAFIIAHTGIVHAGDLYSDNAEVIIPIENGCGIGVRRGPYSGCAPIYPGYYGESYGGYYRSYWTGYRDGYVDGSTPSLMVDQGACSGSQMYRVCNVYGTCWAACN